MRICIITFTFIMLRLLLERFNTTPQLNWFIMLTTLTFNEPIIITNLHIKAIR